MAKRKRTTRKRPAARRTPARRTPARSRPESSAEPLVSPETARAIGGVVLCGLALVLLLALLGAAGPAGRALGNWVEQLLGWASWLLVPACAYFGVGLLEYVPTGRRQAVGAVIIVLSLAGLLHLLVRTNEYTAAVNGDYGGIVGYSITATTGYALGIVGTAILLVAALTIGLFVFRDRGLRRRAADAAPSVDQPDDSPKTPRPDPIRRDPAPASTPEPKPAPKPEPDFKPRVVDSAWEQPPLTLLSNESTKADAGDTNQAGAVIEQTLSNFGLGAEVVGVNVGPTVTQYELRPEATVKLNQIRSLDNDLARALAAHPIRIEAPIPNKSTVGIEAPNRKGATVRLRQLFETKQFKKGGALPLALGLDVSGEPIIADLAEMPHVLIAGATGAGKSVGINALLMSLLYTHSPKHLRLLLVDPKRVELTAYNGIPHLIAPVITDAPKVVNALKWVVSEMERRYQVFEEARVKDLPEYNGKHKKEPLPYLVVVVDELADLMATSGKAVEASIVRIAQLARATGIHLVIATQRPSVNVITGVIKANFPTRMAYTVSSATDSRTILDTSGAEKLLGKGDMLFSSASLTKPVRLQGAFVENQEVHNLTDFLKGKGEPVYDESVTESKQGGSGGGSGGESDDPLYDEARQTVIQTRKASASFLQRRLGIGYARAARLLDQLEENDVIGPGEGAKPREVLVTPDE